MPTLLTQLPSRAQPCQKKQTICASKIHISQIQKFNTQCNIETADIFCIDICPLTVPASNLGPSHQELEVHYLHQSVFYMQSIGY